MFNENFMRITSLHSARGRIPPTIVSGVNFSLHLHEAQSSQTYYGRSCRQVLNLFHHLAVETAIVHSRCIILMRDMKTCRSFSLFLCPSGRVNLVDIHSCSEGLEILKDSGFIAISREIRSYK